MTIGVGFHHVVLYRFNHRFRCNTFKVVMLKWPWHAMVRTGVFFCHLLIESHDRQKRLFQGMKRWVFTGKPPIIMSPIKTTPSRNMGFFEGFFTIGFPEQGLIKPLFLLRGCFDRGYLGGPWNIHISGCKSSGCKSSMWKKNIFRKFSQFGLMFLDAKNWGLMTWMGGAWRIRLQYRILKVISQKQRSWDVVLVNDQCMYAKKSRGTFSGSEAPTHPRPISSIFAMIYGFPDSRYFSRCYSVLISRYPMVNSL